jgi:hypothetical protein
MKRFIAIIAVVCMSVPCFAQSSDAAKSAKVEELMSIMHVDKMMDQMMSMMKGQMLTAMQSAGNADTMTPAQKKICADFESNAMDLAIQSVSWKALQPDFVKLYTDNFTDQQIDDILAFYKSPTGQAFIDKQPVLMRQGMQITQGKIAALEPQMNALLEQFKKDMAAAGPSQQKPAASDRSN